MSEKPKKPTQSARTPNPTPDQQGDQLNYEALYKSQRRKTRAVERRAKIANAKHKNALARLDILQTKLDLVRKINEGQIQMIEELKSALNEIESTLRAGLTNVTDPYTDMKV